MAFSEAEKRVIYRGYGALYHYQSSTSRWSCGDDPDTRIFVVGPTSPSKPHLIVGQSCSDDTFVLNTWIFRKIVLRQSGHFVQWQDPNGVYGLSFEDEEQCRAFVFVVEKTLLQRNRDLSTGRYMESPQERREISSQTVTRVSKPRSTKRKMGFGGSVRVTNVEEVLQESCPVVAPMKLEPQSLRDRKAFEIYFTEVSYCDILCKVCYTLLYPLRQSNLIPPADRTALFANVEEIMEVNLKFLKSLEAKLEEWNQETTSIGNLFLDILPDFKVYTNYYKNYTDVPKLLEKLGKHRKTREWLEGSHMQETTNGQGLPHLLIQPCQRLMRYSLLVNELLKETSEEHPDRQPLTEAYQGLQKATVEMNESVRESSNQKILSHIATNPNQFLGFQDIIEPSRVLLYTCACTVVLPGAKFEKVYLFNDMVLFCEVFEEKKVMKTKVAECISMNQIWIDRMDTKPSLQVMLYTANGQYIVQLANQNDKKALLEGLEPAVEKVVGTITNENGQRFIQVNFTNGDQYTGQLVNARPHGTGTFRFANKNIYHGSFQMGKFCGEGEMVYFIGSDQAPCQYKGTWTDDLYDGEGTLDFEGNTYVGSWVKGKKDGFGKITWMNGATYSGDWVQDLQHGKGVLVSKATGESYDGSWCEGKFHGSGKLKWAYGKYEGDFVHDVKEGKGKLWEYSFDGLRYYEGQWKNDLQNGFGKLEINPDGPGGLRYEGEWQEGAMCGQGTLHKNGGISYKGEFRGDRMHCDNAEITYPDGSHFEGSIKNDRKHGPGKLLLANGDEYVGNFHSNLRYGRGKLTSVAGWTYEGEWGNDEFNGKGVLTLPNGAKYSGGWEHSMPQGAGVYQYKNLKYVGNWDQGLPSGAGTLTTEQGKAEGNWSSGVPDGDSFVFKQTGEEEFVFTGGFKNGQPNGEGKVTFNKTDVECYFNEGVVDRPSIQEFPPLGPFPFFVFK